MNISEYEEYVYRSFQQIIAKSCYRKWCSLEPSDRRQEAAFVFLCTLRTPRVTNANLWDCYEATLKDYMNGINRRESQNKRHIFLNAALGTGLDGGCCTLMDFIPLSYASERNEKIWRFLHTLSENEKEFCECAIFDHKKSNRQFSLKMGLSSKEITDMRASIANQYRKFDEDYIG